MTQELRQREPTAIPPRTAAFSWSSPHGLRLGWLATRKPSCMSTAATCTGLDGDKNGIACERNPAPHDQEPVPLWESRSMGKQRREVMSLAVAVKPEGFQRGIMWGTLAD